MPRKQSRWEAIWESVKSCFGGCVAVFLVLVGVPTLFLLVLVLFGIFADIHGCQ